MSRWAQSIHLCFGLPLFLLPDGTIICSLSSDVVLVLSVMTWPISSIGIACMHHRRRSLKTVLHAHRLTKVPLHFRHILVVVPVVGAKASPCRLQVILSCAVISCPSSICPGLFVGLPCRFTCRMVCKWRRCVPSVVFHAVNASCPCLLQLRVAIWCHEATQHKQASYDVPPAFSYYSVLNLVIQL